jgi:hypothetical protein
MNSRQSNINIVLVCLLVGGALLFGLLGKPTEMGLMIVACSLALAFANLDRIQRFKGAGFEAEMRKAVEEAYATTENLRSLAKPLVLSMLENLLYGGRWGGMGPARKHRLKDELDALSKSLGIRDAEITDTLHKFYIWHGIDHIDRIDAVMAKNKISNKEVLKALGGVSNRNVDELPPVQAVRAALNGLKQEELVLLEPLVENYEHYRTHKTLRPAAGSFE